MIDVRASPGDRQATGYANRQCAETLRPAEAGTIRHALHGVPAAVLLLAGCVYLAGPAGAAAARQETIAFVGGTLINGTGADPLADAAVVVTGDRIRQVGPAAQLALPAGARTIDVSGKWVIPGLIDAHVHFFQSASLYTRPDIIDLRRVRPYDRELAWLRERIPSTLARYIASGVTAVADLAGPVWTFEVRELAGRLPVSPRVAVAGPGLAPTLPAAMTSADPPGVIVRTPAEARERVQRLQDYHPDLLKIWFLYSPDMDLDREMQWVRAAVGRAHAQGLRAAAHATHLELARKMVEAGVDILVHSVDDQPVDRAFIELLRNRGTLYIPTLMVGEGYQEVLGRNVVLSDIERRTGDPAVIAGFADLHRLFPRLPRRPVTPPDPVVLDNLKRLAEAGVTVAAGSDAGNIGTLHGPALHRELELMHAAGLAPNAVLVAATAAGARVLGRADELGTIEPGKLADLLILDADPLQDIRNTRRIHRVVKGGEVHDPETLLNRLATR
ncbi:MAG: amidohydrolase family protein [Gammaproteobacteria bacterium]|jgi:imidazolonepropionase-like amidohydrolase